MPKVYPYRSTKYIYTTNNRIVYGGVKQGEVDFPNLFLNPTFHIGLVLPDSPVPVPPELQLLLLPFSIFGESYLTIDCEY